MTSRTGPGPEKPRNAATDERSSAAAAPSLSRIVLVDDVPDGGLEISIKADAAECAAIARRGGLVAVDSLEADLVVAKRNETEFTVAGPLVAQVTQTCVVSLDPFPETIRADVEADFVLQPRTSGARRGRAAQEKGRGEMPLASFAAQLEAPEPIVDGRIDVGALAEEFLFLSLDPHPRRPGVRFDSATFVVNPEDAPSPFAILKKLKDAD